MSKFCKFLFHLKSLFRSYYDYDGNVFKGQYFFFDLQDDRRMQRAMYLLEMLDHFSIAQHLGCL